MYFKVKLMVFLIKEGIAHECINKHGKTASQCCRTDEDKETIQRAIREERQLLKQTINRVKDLEENVSFLKRKLLELAEIVNEGNKRNKLD